MQIICTVQKEYLPLAYQTAKANHTNLKFNIMTIEKAVANFLQFVSNGWNIEVALESCHDTVYDLISLKDFGAKCLRAVGVAKIANLNQN